MWMICQSISSEFIDITKHIEKKWAKDRMICCIISIMKRHITKHIKPIRLAQLPSDMRTDLKEARERRGWSQRELGAKLGLPQMHVSGIESGKIVPRFDTLLDYVRSLDYDLVLVPRTLVPAVLALIREHKASNQPGQEEERALYAVDEEERQTKERRSDEI